jgi:hypothetical protein
VRFTVVVVVLPRGVNEPSEPLLPREASVAVQGQESKLLTSATGESAKVSVTAGVGWAILIEPDKDPRKVLRVTLPLGMQLAHGTRIAIDQKQPATGSYVICFSNGCQSDYDASAEMISRLKKRPAACHSGDQFTGPGDQCEPSAG